MTTLDTTVERLDSEPLIGVPASTPILGTGSGRCGTLSLAAELDIDHEPGYKRDYWQEHPDMDNPLQIHTYLEHYKKCGDMAIKNRGGFVDTRLSLNMELAMQWWPEAHWVIVYRYPMHTIYSWKNRGEGLWGLPDDRDWVEVLAKRWVMHYESIIFADPGNFEYVCADEDLRLVLNKQEHQTPNLDKADMEIISDVCRETLTTLEENRYFQPRPLFGKARRPWDND